MPTMPRIALVKKNRVVVLRGTIHIAEKPVFDFLKEEMEEFIKQGFFVFAEGTHRRCTKSRDIRERRLRLFDLMFAYYIPKLIAEERKMVLQRDLVRYDKATSMYVDISVSEIAHRFLEARLDETMLVKAVTFIGLSERQARMVAGQKTIAFPMYLSKLINYLVNTNDEFLEVIVHQRNAFVFKAIDESDLERIFVHYGSSHIRGLTKLLVLSGWQVTQRIYDHV